MTHVERILELWHRVEATDGSAVLATVVKTQGSSYRLPGARLLIARDGQRAGSVSGGCLEDDLVKKAWWMTEDGPSVRRYDTTPDGEIGPSFGLGCNGVVHVLLERIVKGGFHPIQLSAQVRKFRQPAVMAHIFHPRELVGQKLVIDTAGALRCGLSNQEFAQALEQEARIALATLQSRAISVGNVEALVEVLTPPIRLLVFGAGDDAIPVVELANYFGWNVVVVDGRAHHVRRERFPLADAIQVRSPGSAEAQRPAIDPWTAAVLMTHSYRQDLEILRELTAQPLPYLGILGPRKRTEQLLEDAELTPADIGLALHSPMGLDIGADGPEQVALAVVAEIQARFNGRRGGPLRERAGSIHSEENEVTDCNVHLAPSVACF